MKSCESNFGKRDTTFSEVLKKVRRIPDLEILLCASIYSIAFFLNAGTTRDATATKIGITPSSGIGSNQSKIESRAQIRTNTILSAM